MKSDRLREWAKWVSARGGILLFFIIAFEVAIMISPFAFFFYSVFNPIFRGLERFAATRWLTAFFLPHMILPPTVPLKVIRVLGSVLFVTGCVTFFVCAAQVYLAKLLKWGVASRGLYRYVRHPQYLALGIWGIGLALLWPRFIVLAALALMFVLYNLLARDEERRMLAQHGDGYASYMNMTGMFLPAPVEKRLSFVAHLVPAGRARSVALPVLVLALVMGTGFVLRAATLLSLPLQTERNLTMVPILPEDRPLVPAALAAIVPVMGQGEGSLLRDDRDYLAYLMPADYIMQGMIADTGAECRLHEQHNTLALVTDWVIHPFEHLRRPPSAQMAKMHGCDPAVARRQHCPLGIDEPGLKCGACPYRRIVIVEVVSGEGGHVAGRGLFSFGCVRTPVCYADVDTKTREIVRMSPVGPSTAWKGVPTPAI